MSVLLTILALAMPVHVGAVDVWEDGSYRVGPVNGCLRGELCERPVH